MRKQVLILTSWSFLFVAPLLITVGTNVVTHTYQEAAERFWSGLSPYLAQQKGDIFLYSPFFAEAYGLFAFLPSKVQALAWALLNSFVFWLGVSNWFSFSRNTSKFTLVALVVCSMELDGSLRYQQVNALLAGIILMGLAHYRDGRLVQSGGWLALGTNLKLLPVLFAGLLAWPLRRRYVVGFAVTVVALIAISGPVLHLDWWKQVTGDIDTRKMLDVAAVFERLGIVSLGKFLWWAIAALTCVGMFATRFLIEDEFPWGAWISVGLCALLLLSPKSESPTFVLMAPAYLFLSSSNRPATRVCLLVGMFLVTVSYNDVWPRFLRLPLQENFSTKTLGTLLLSAAATLELYGDCLRFRKSAAAS